MSDDRGPSMRETEPIVEANGAGVIRVDAEVDEVRSAGAIESRARASRDEPAEAATAPRRPRSDRRDVAGAVERVALAGRHRLAVDAEQVGVEAAAGGQAISRSGSPGGLGDANDSPMTSARASASRPIGVGWVVPALQDGASRQRYIRPCGRVVEQDHVVAAALVDEAVGGEARNQVRRRAQTRGSPRCRACGRGRRTAPVAWPSRRRTRGVLGPADRRQRLKNGSFSPAEKSITASPKSRQPRPGIAIARAGWTSRKRSVSGSGRTTDRGRSGVAWRQRYGMARQ
jgi:hypothetical protein